MGTNTTMAPTNCCLREQSSSQRNVAFQHSGETLLFALSGLSEVNSTSYISSTILVVSTCMEKTRR